MNAGFIAAYPNTRNAELAKQFGVSEATVSRWAWSLGLKKSPSHRAAVQKANATGKIKSPETRSKIRAKALGRTFSVEAKAKALHTTRERGTLLKGGRPWERFKDPQYLVWRNAVLERDRYICQQCRRQCKKHERGLAAHHIKSFADHPALRYDVANGVTLCRACHMALHNRDISPPELIPCACGCGTMIPSRDCYGRPRRYVNYHAARGTRRSAATRKLISQRQKGKILSVQHRAKISSSLRLSSKRIGRPHKRVD